MKPRMLIRGLAVATFLSIATAPPAGPVEAGSGQTPEAAASSRCRAPGYRQFDFWIGVWDVRTPDGTLAGTNTIRSILDGCALQEHWKGSKGSEGTSFNIYVAATDRWHQTWVDNAGLLLQLGGRLENGVMKLEGVTPAADGRRTLHRLSFTPLDRDRVRQVWAQSSDNGREWKIVFDGTYVRTSGTAAQ